MKTLLDGKTEWRYNPKFSLLDPLESPLWNDSRLSAKSKGIWGYMKSKPHGWDFAAERMANDFTDGKKGVQSSIRELESNGYLERKKLSTGRVHYFIVEDPWVGIEPTIEKSSIAKYHVFLDEPTESIGHSTNDAVEALMLAYGAYDITREQAIDAIDGQTFTSYHHILDWLDSDKDTIDHILDLPLAVNF
jgi:hypothetical protein